jgi:ATP-dependent exoDNAse (exonuclease V) alpha subunit
MSIYHCSIKIISRAGGRSAVASAAYRSGEKLYNDETGLIHDFTNKGGVIMNEILLPINAPERYRDREILWNEVQKIEKRSDAQFAREIEVALPVEMSREQQIACVRDYVQENFVKRGMIAGWALHDKADGNPHAHILLTMRGIDEHEEWLQKQKTVFANARDDKGRPIYNPDLPVYDSKNRDAASQYRIPQLDQNGKQKTRVRKGKGTEYLWEKISISANDWNEHSQAEIWRASWAEHCNRYLDVEHKIDHRSYERQGIEKEPSIHEGVTAKQMEAEGKVSDRCQMNREIKERNSIREQMKKMAKELTDLITEKARGIYGRFKEFARGRRNTECSGTDDGYIGETAVRDRNDNKRKSGLEGAVGRIHEIKRAVDITEQEAKETDREIVGTDEDIAITNQRIAELKELTKRKEAERDE